MMFEIARPLLCFIFVAAGFAVVAIVGLFMLRVVILVLNKIMAVELRNQAEVCKLLRDADQFMTRDAVNLSKLVPAPFIVDPGADASGYDCHPRIWARAEGLPDVLVWQGYISNYGSSYVGKLGYQPGCGWAAPVLEKFFNDVAGALAAAEADWALKEAQRERQYKDAVAAYKAMFWRAQP